MLMEMTQSLNELFSNLENVSWNLLYNTIECNSLSTLETCLFKEVKMFHVTNLSIENKSSTIVAHQKDL